MDVLVVMVTITMADMVVWSSEHTGRPGHTGQIDLTFKPDFPGNLWRAAFAILAMFCLWFVLLPTLLISKQMNQMYELFSFFSTSSETMTNFDTCAILDLLSAFGWRHCFPMWATWHIWQAGWRRGRCTNRQTDRSDPNYCLQLGAQSAFSPTTLQSYLGTSFDQSGVPVVSRTSSSVQQ